MLCVFLTGARVLCLQAQKADLLILTVGEDSVNTDDGDIESLELSPSQVLSRASVSACARFGARRWSNPPFGAW